MLPTENIKERFVLLKLQYIVVLYYYSITQLSVSLSLFCTGGAMKRKTYGCYCCNIRKEDLATPNVQPCDDCRELGREGPCFHQTVSDEALMRKLSKEYDQILQENPHLANYPYRESRIRYGASAIRDVRSDYRHIDFDCNRSSVTERLKFAALLEKELAIRGIPPCSRQTANMRLQLYEILLVEHRYSTLKEVLSESSLEDAMVKLEKTIPCLLHLENRTSEAIITQILLKALNERDGDTAATEELMAQVERLMNNIFFWYTWMSFQLEIPGE